MNIRCLEDLEQLHNSDQLLSYCLLIVFVSNTKNVSKKQIDHSWFKEFHCNNRHVSRNHMYLKLIT